MALKTDNLVVRLVAGLVDRARAGDEANVLVRALSDPRPAVAREARHALAARHVVARERLLGLYASAEHPHTRTQVLALLARGGRADSMVSLLAALAITGPAAPVQKRGVLKDRRFLWATLEARARHHRAAVGQACRHIEDWLATWTPLSRADACRLAAALLDAQDALPPALAERLWVYVRDQGRIRRPERKRAPKPVKWVKVVKPPVLQFLGGRVRHRSYEMTPTWWGWCRGVVLGVVEGVM